MRRLLLLLFAITATAAIEEHTPRDVANHIAHDGIIAAISDSVAPLPRPLPFFYDLYSFRGDEGNTTVVAAFAVPVRRLGREWHERQARYRFDVALVLADTARHTVTRTDDSVYVSVPQQLSGDHLLYTHVEVQTLPSNGTVQRVTMSDAARPGTGQLYSTEYVIPDYSGTHLMISDVAMGQPNPRAGWTRDDVTLALLPTSQFPGSSFELFYEIYNLPAGSIYTTRVAIAPVDEGGSLVVGADGVVDASFSATSEAEDGAAQAEFRTVDARIQKGTYRITIEITDEGSGESATQFKNFEVRGPGRGATMVPALPSERLRGNGRPTPN